MNCPICNVALVIADRQGVEIDYCPQCRGVWLDRGELDKIIERASSRFGDGDRDRPDDRRDDDRDREYREPREGRKRESFLSELFDF